MSRLQALARERILILDGAMGTMIQAKGLDQEAYRYNSILAEGSSEILNLTRSDVIASIHRAYIDAGADIIETNTFCANRINLAEYELEDHTTLINERACAIARAEAGDKTLVAGVMGPTNHALSLSAKVEDPAWRRFEFDDFYHAYLEQALALIEGGVDLLLIETVFDTLVAKSAIIASLDAMDQKGKELPIMVSVTFSDASGRTLSGQSLEAFVHTMASFPLFSIGLNCSTGPEEMIGLIQALSDACPFYVSAHPNAGFPDKEGHYNLTPSAMAEALQPLLQAGKLNIVGGCCGTTDEHIKLLKETAQSAPARKRPTQPTAAFFTGLDPVYQQSPEDPLVVGERTNVAGSRKFARLIRQERWDEAVAIAREQVTEGSQLLDVCMDASLLDAQVSMQTFLRHLGSDPTVSRVAVMIDSSDWSVIESGMREVQGRGVINSISLKEGEKAFLSHARQIARFGYAMVVMLFDEKGQADTYERKMEIARRSHCLLVGAGINEGDIIFDANVLAIATGIAEHDGYAKAFIDATHQIKREFPRVRTSGGISNLSFSFRGNDALRSAMHERFIAHAALDLVIINPASMKSSSSLDERSQSIIDQALLQPSDEASARLVELAISLQQEGGSKAPAAIKETETDPKKRLTRAIEQGLTDTLLADLSLLEEENPIALVEGPLMDGMREVGRLFGEGKLFLPQVVRSARVMKVAVDALQPRITAFLEQGKGVRGTRRKAVMATVKGDVHDIGKNIVSLILQCNDFEVVDLGVMVEAQDILEAAQSHRADLVGLSGLITPSLKQMEGVITLFEKAGCTTPIFVGGATTSELHTAIKLAPLYSNTVIQTQDASAMALAANKLLGSEGPQYVLSLKERYQSLREKDRGPERVESSYEGALTKGKQKIHGSKAAEYGVWTTSDFSLSALVEEISWRQYCAAWKVPSESAEAADLIARAKKLLQRTEVIAAFEGGCAIVYGLFDAESDRLAVKVKESSFYFLRNERSGKSLADYIAPNDTIGLFVSTSSTALAPLISRYEEEGALEEALQLRLLADRIADVLAQRAEKLLRARWDRSLPSFVRPAPGYPIWSDHSEKETIFSLLRASERIGVRLTESWAMDPPSSVCGMLIGGEDLSYFTIGEVSSRQLALYAQRKGIDEALLYERLATMG